MALRIEEAAPVGPADFEAFYAAFAPRVRGLIRQRVRNSHRVEDLVQETFLRAHRNAGSFDTTLPAWPWLAAIANNLVIDSARRRSNALEQPVEIKYLDHADATADLGDHYQRVERRQAIADVLGRLPERQRRVLVLRDVDGLRYDDVAEREGVTVDTVKALLKRARGGFRQAYSTLADERGLWAIGLLPLRYLRRGIASARDKAESSSARFGQWFITLAEGAVAPAAAVVASAALSGIGIIGTDAVLHRGTPPTDAAPGAHIAGVHSTSAATRAAATHGAAGASNGHGVWIGPFTLPPPPSNTPPVAGAGNRIGATDDFFVQRDHVKLSVLGIPIAEHEGTLVARCHLNAASEAFCAAARNLPPAVTDLTIGNPQPLPDDPPPPPDTGGLLP